MQSKELTQAIKDLARALEITDSCARQRLLMHIKWSPMEKKEAERIFGVGYIDMLTREYQQRTEDHCEEREIANKVARAIYRDKTYTIAKMRGTLRLGKRQRFTEKDFELMKKNMREKDFIKVLEVIEKYDKNCDNCA